MNRLIPVYATVFSGVLACLMFCLSFYIGLTDRMPIDSRLWSGPDDANSVSQILWVLAAIPGAIFFLMVERYGVFDHIRIHPVFSNIRTGIPISRITAFVWVALITLGAGSCMGNIAIQISDRYLNPSCFYQSPC